MRVLATVADGVMQGFSARLSRASPRTIPFGNLPLGRFAPRGETPRRYRAHPFCGAGAKNKRLYRFFTLQRSALGGSRMRYGCRRARDLNARVHWAFSPLAATPARGKPRSPPARSRATRSQPSCVGGGWAGLLPPGPRTSVCSYSLSPLLPRDERSFVRKRRSATDNR